MNFERIWIYNTYSSGVYLPAQGDVVTEETLGGSTTTTFQRVFISEIQTGAPGFAIGTGYDNVLLDTCAVDKATAFGYFKCQPLSIRNCSSEGIRNPIIGSIENAHQIINLLSGHGQTIDGFHVTMDASFSVVAPGPGLVNSFLSAYYPGRLSLSGLRGAIPETYYGLDLKGGKCNYNTNSLGLGYRVVYDGELWDYSKRTNRTELSGGTGGNSAPTTLWEFEDGKNIYLLYTTYSHAGAAESTAWIVFTSESTGTGYATKLSSGPDYSTSITIAIVPGTPSIVQYSTHQNLYCPWQAFKLNLFDK